MFGCFVSLTQSFVCPICRVICSSALRRGINTGACVSPIMSLPRLFHRFADLPFAGQGTLYKYSAQSQSFSLCVRAHK